jgi:hypothetical protein
MKRAALLLSFALSLLVPSLAAAQSFGIGPRFAFVRGDVTTGTPSTRFFGGTVRMSGSKHTAFEVAIDYRSTLNTDPATPDHKVKMTETPIQGSLLLYLVRSPFSPYLLGGAGIYSRRFDDLGPQGQVLASTTDRKVGVHLGVGADLFVGRHVALYGDYRYRFVRFGTPAAEDQPINIPGGSLVPGLDKLKVSHQGSMWTGGVAFYF